MPMVDILDNIAKAVRFLSSINPQSKSLDLLRESVVDRSSCSQVDSSAPSPHQRRLANKFGKKAPQKPANMEIVIPIGTEASCRSPAWPSRKSQRKKKIRHGRIQKKL